MQILKRIFSPIVFILGFISNHFKAFIFLLIVYVLFFGSTPNKQANLAQIDLTGAITSSEIIKKIEQAKDDINIKGVLLNVDSPGGALAPSVEISMAVKRLSSKKPVVAYASGTMASGSYLSSIYATKIYANPGSFIGSIGVIMQGVNLELLLKRVGVSEQTVSAGEFKQAGTPTRAWSKAEKEELQNLVDKSYELFTTEVARARNLELSSKDIWANARVFLAHDAAKLGLIDEVGDYFTAKKEVEKLSGVDECLWQEKSSYDKFVDGISQKSVNFILGILSPVLR